MYLGEKNLPNLDEIVTLSDDDNYSNVADVDPTFHLLVNKNDQEDANPEERHGKYMNSGCAPTYLLAALLKLRRTFPDAARAGSGGAQP